RFRMCKAPSARAASSGNRNHRASSTVVQMENCCAMLRSATSLGARSALYYPYRVRLVMPAGNQRFEVENGGRGLGRCGGLPELVALPPPFGELAALSARRAPGRDHLWPSGAPALR